MHKNKKRRSDKWVNWFSFKWKETVSEGIGYNEERGEKMSDELELDFTYSVKKNSISIKNGSRFCGVLGLYSLTSTI